MEPESTQSVPLLYMRNRYYDLVDSLAFVDAVPVELEGTIKDLIESEKRLIVEEFNGNEEQALESYVKTLPPTPDHTGSGHLYHEEVKRKSTEGTPLEAVDLSRYNGYAEEKDIERRMEHMKTLMEYVQGTQINLELLDRYKEAAWLRHLEDLTEMRESMEKVKGKLTSEVEQLNKVRKLHNIEWAGRLRSINQEYEEYQKKNKQLLCAIEKVQNSKQGSIPDE